MTEIKTFPMSDLTIGAACDFHTNVKALVDAATAQALLIEDKMPAYAANIVKLQSVVNRQRAFVSTRSLKEADTTRDRAIGTIMTVVRAYSSTPVADKKEVALRLQPALAAYKSIATHEYTKETSEVRGLLAVLDHPDNAPLVAALHLEPEVEALREANQIFTAAFMDRSEEWSDRDDIMEINSKELVMTLNAQYANICKYINAYALVMSTEAIDTFINKLNGVVRAFAAIVDGKTSGGGSEDETPSNPGTPSNPDDDNSNPSNPDTPSNPDDDDNNPGGNDGPGTGGFMG